MDPLIRMYRRLIDSTKTIFVRYLINDIDWNDRLIAISGARGTGKTTLLLQYIKLSFADKNKALYVSLDNIWFTTHTLVDLAEDFYAMGGTSLFLDEVHRYPNWAIEVKNIYDSYPDLKIVFTGSSMLEIYKAGADLSRRAVHYELFGLSFREFLEMETGKQFPVLALPQLVENHTDLATSICSDMRILPKFYEYLEHGYYPLYRESIKSFANRIHGIVNAVIDSDLPACSNIEYSSGLKIKKLLSIISGLVPYTPNISKLSSEMGISRNSLLSYIHLLHKAGLTFSLTRDAAGMSYLTKPEKIYLDNTNLLHALCIINTNDGNVRETFFANQLKVRHKVTASEVSDFTIDNHYTFEVGGKNKTSKQIKNTPDSYIAMDGIEIGAGNKVPLWLFGFTY